MERFRKLLHQKEWIYLVAVAIGIRACLVDFSIGQSLAFFAALGYLSLNKYFSYLESKTKAFDINEQISKELSEVRANVSGLMMKNATKPQEMSKELKRFF